MDWRFVSHRPGEKQLYPRQGYPHPPRVDSLPLQTYIYEKQREKPLSECLTVCNVALDSVVSDMFGKSATAITDCLTSDKDFDAQHCVSLLQRSLRKKAEDVLQSIEGYEITAEQKTRIGIIRIICTTLTP